MQEMDHLKTLHEHILRETHGRNSCSSSIIMPLAEFLTYKLEAWDEVPKMDAKQA